jgi:hypothetical protein
VDNPGLSHLKFFEYMASGTPMLMVGGQENLYSGLLEFENLGFKANSSIEVADLLRDMIYKRSILKTQNDLSHISQYSYKKLGEKLDTVISKLVKEKNN